jgi:zinc transport system ATP-binding protein
MNKLIEVEHVTASYDGGRSMALRDVSLTLYEEEFLGIVGPNGGGKTTLLKIILGLLTPVSGKVRFFREGRETTALRMGYLPQMTRIDKKFPISVRDVIASGLMAEKPPLRNYTDVQYSRVDEVVYLMGLTELASRPIGELSGGQLQRTLLGRAIIANPQVLILDEPSSYVDKEFETHFFKLLAEVHRSSAIMMVTHDHEALGNMASRMVFVKETLQQQ